MRLSPIRWSDIAAVFHTRTLQTPRPRKRHSSHSRLERLEERALLSATMTGERHSIVPPAVAMEAPRFDVPNAGGIWTVSGDGDTFSGILQATQRGKKVSGRFGFEFEDPPIHTVNFKNAKFKKHSPNVLVIKGTADNVPVDVVIIFDGNNSFHGNLKVDNTSLSFTGEGAHP